MGFQGSGKSTGIELHKRRDEVMTFLLEGVRPQRIIDTIRDSYSISQNAVEKDMQWCYKRFKEQNQIDIAALVDIHIARYEELYGKLNEMMEHEKAAKMLQYKEKLLGLDKPKVLIQNNTVNLDLKKISLDELKKLINE